VEEPEELRDIDSVAFRANSLGPLRPVRAYTEHLRDNGQSRIRAGVSFNVWADNMFGSDMVYLLDDTPGQHWNALRFANNDIVDEDITSEIAVSSENLRFFGYRFGPEDVLRSWIAQDVKILSTEPGALVAMAASFGRGEGDPQGIRGS
jgi:hypothetical protein